jgi:reverse gyrase
MRRVVDTARGNIDRCTNCVGYGALSPRVIGGVTCHACLPDEGRETTDVDVVPLD